MKRIIYLAVVTFIGLTSFAEPTVTDVVAKQRYPWGLVDITCKVSGIDETIADRQFVVSAVFPDSENAVKMSKVWVIRDGVKSGNLAADANGNYRLLWDAKADLGEARYTNMIVRVIIKERLMVQLWTDGPYWATTNIGAEKPEDYGYYFWWGDTVGCKRENDKWVASDGSNSNFSFGDTPLQSEGWITADGVLAPEYDAAKKHWGGDWRMPTTQEFGALKSKCDWVWTTTNGVNGYVVRGKGDYLSKSIFLPCAGDGSGTSLSGDGSSGYYWSSVPRSDGRNAWYLGFSSSYHSTSDDYRGYGRSVRPLQGFTK